MRLNAQIPHKVVRGYDSKIVLGYYLRLYTAGEHQYCTDRDPEMPVESQDTEVADSRVLLSYPPQVSGVISGLVKPTLNDQYTRPLFKYERFDAAT